LKKEFTILCQVSTYRKKKKSCVLSDEQNEIKSSQKM